MACSRLHQEIGRTNAPNWPTFSGPMFHLDAGNFPEILKNFQNQQQQGIATQQSLFFGPNPEISGKIKSENSNQKKTESSVSLGRTRRAHQPGRRLPDQTAAGSKT